MKSCRGSSELIFVVLNFVTPEARYANDVNNRLKIRGWKNSWVENFVTRGIVTKITKISTPRKLPAIRYYIHTAILWSGIVLYITFTLQYCGLGLYLQVKCYLSKLVKREPEGHLFKQVST